MAPIIQASLVFRSFSLTLIFPGHAGSPENVVSGWARASDTNVCQIQNPGMPVQNLRQLPESDAILVIRVLFKYTGLSIAGLSHAGSSWLLDVFGLHLKHTKAKRIL